MTRVTIHEKENSKNNGTTQISDPTNGDSNGTRNRKNKTLVESERATQAAESHEAELSISSSNTNSFLFSHLV